MGEFLEATYDKFVFKVKDGCLYNRDDFWVAVKGSVATVGITDYLFPCKRGVKWRRLCATFRRLRRLRRLDARAACGSADAKPANVPGQSPTNACSARQRHGPLRHAEGLLAGTPMEPKRGRLNGANRRRQRPVRGLDNGVHGNGRLHHLGRRAHGCRRRQVQRGRVTAKVRL